MSVKKLALVAALGMSMASAPVMAQTAPSASPAQIERASAELEEANDQGRGNAFGRRRGTTTYIIAFFVIIVIALGIYFAIDDDNEGTVSP